MFKNKKKTTLPSLKRKQKHRTLASKTLNFKEKEDYRSHCRKIKLYKWKVKIKPKQKKKIQYVRTPPPKKKNLLIFMRSEKNIDSGIFKNKIKKKKI